MQHVIETFSLTKTFSDKWGRDKVCAVKDLSLKVSSNEIFGLLGPNGSGKTTTIKMLLSLLNPTKGHCLVLGGNAAEPKINTKIGFLPEESYLYKYLNARETLDFYGRLFSLPSKIRKVRIEALLDMVGLKAVANRAVGTYSKGMARRIGLAQALINDPELLILDEPTTGLDPIGTRQIKDLIIQLAKRGKTILLCSHLLADVEDVCDRIAILYGGKLQALGQVRQLLRQTDKKQITTDHISDTAIEKIEEILKENQVNYEFSSPMEKLETYFINTVANAQKQKTPTSGAVSKTEINNFLSGREDEKKRTEMILEKLVSAKPVEKQSVNESDESTQEPQQQITQETNKELLDNLVKESQIPAAEPAVDTETQKPQQIEQPEESTKNLLDELTKGNTSAETKKPQGGSNDA